MSAMTVNRGHDIETVLRRAIAYPGAGLVLLTSMDFNALLATPLERHCRVSGRRMVRRSARNGIAVAASRTGWTVMPARSIAWRR